MSLPPGLTMTTDGVISGTPTTPGVYPFWVVVLDSAGGTAAAELQLVVSPALVVTITGLPAAVQGQGYTFALQATGGDPPYTWVQQ